MNKVKTCLWITLLTAMATGQQPALLNRIVATVYDSNAGIGKIVFTDTETGDMVKYDLPPNFRPGYLVAMDKRGDVWLDDYDTWMLRKFSAVDGSVLATALPSRRVSYMVTDQNGSLVVGSRNLLTGLQAAVYIDRFTSDGAYIDGVDLTTLFPPGVMIPARLAAATANAPQVSFDGIPRILITKSGAIWVGVLRSAYNPVIRLTPDLKLDVSFAIYQPWAMVPDDGEGAWVFFNNALASTYLLNAPPLPGLPTYGWAHLSAQGQVISFSTDGTALGNLITPSHGHRRYDGRQFQYQAPGGSNGPGHIRVSKPGNPMDPSFPWADRIEFQSSNLPYAFLSGFHLDGAQRVWAHRNSYSGSNPPDWAIAQWTRFPVEAPYTNVLGVEIGEASRLSPIGPLTWYWSSYWGNATLFEYVHYTDPFGDLDGDGVPNNVELANFSNPLLPFGYSDAATATGSGGAPGTPFTVNYSIPGDQNLDYVAPFALMQPITEHLGGGRFLPISLSDPLVIHSLTPGVSGVTGTIGVMSPQATATATIQIPQVPALSGLSFASCIATRDPNLPLPLKTISRAFQFTIP